MVLRIFFYLSWLLACVSFQAAAAIKIPAGFEELARGQTLWLDVSLYGEPLGLYQANVDLETVRFINPNKLISAVIAKYGDTSELKNLLMSSLSAPLARNGALACSINGDRPGCGFINPRGVAIIYDENNARIDLFLASKFSPVTDTGTVYYHNAPDSHNGLIHQQILNFVAGPESQSLSLQGNGTLGLTDAAYANIDWSYIGQRYRSESNTQLDLNNAYVRQDMWHKVYLQAGQMDSRDIFTTSGGNINLSQLPIGKIQGVRVGSTMAWINKEKSVPGTPVTVFLSRDSRVDAYRDNRLLESFYLDAGAQKLDTRAFPSGSYIVTMQIYEDNKLVRTQKVPYTSIFASSDHTFQWFLQAGKLINEPGEYTDDNQQVLLGGIRIPLMEQLSLTTGTTLLNNVNYEEGALDWSHGFDSGPIDGVMTSRASYLYGSKGSSGNVQQISYNDGFSLSFYRSAASSPDCNTQSNKRYSSSGCYTNNSVMFSVPVKGWNATLGYLTSQNAGRYVYRNQLLPEDKRYSAGAPWEQVYTTRSYSRVWQTGLTKVISWSGTNINTSINAFLRHDSGYQGSDRGGYITVSFSGRNRSGPTDPGSSSSLSSSWRTNQRDGGEFSYGGSYSRYMDNTRDNELGAAMSGVATRSVNVSAFGLLAGQYGQSSLNFSDAFDRQIGTHTLSTSGSYSSSFAIDRDGFFWGRWGDGAPASAVTVGVEAGDDDKTSRVNVSVDGGGRADIRSNSHALFTVPGYQQSTVSFSESTNVMQGVSSEINKGSGSRSLFMMPGKIYNHAISLSSRYTWLGRMTDTENTPLEGAIPLNVVSWSPLGRGGFSVETTHAIKSLYVMRGDDYLQCPVRVKSVRDVVRWVGTVRCENISIARLPEAEKQQATLMTVGLEKKTDTTTAMNTN